MKLKRLLSILLSISVIGLCTSVKYYQAEAKTESSSVSSTAQKKTIVLDSSKGATANDLQNALRQYQTVNYDSTGRTTIKLAGSFRIDSTLTLYSGIILDAANAVIYGNAELFLVSYSKSGFTVKGGTWNIGSNSQFMKISGSDHCSIESAKINGGGSQNNGNLMLYNSNSITIKNCVFNKSTSQAVLCHSSYGVTLCLNRIYNTDGHGIYIYGGKSDSNGKLTDFRSYDMKVIGNTISNACGDGIKCVLCGSGCIVSGNTIKSIRLNKDLDYDAWIGAARSGVGIKVMECEGIKLGKAYGYNGKTYEGNTITKTENYGVCVNLCNDTLVNKLNFTDIGANGIHNTASSRTVIQNCSFKECADSGIFLTPGPDNSVVQDKRTSRGSKIKNNTIDGCASFGIVLSKARGTIVSGNRITNCKDYAVYCIGTAFVSIYNNSVYNTKTYNGSGIGSKADCKGTKLSDNHIISISLNKASMSLGKGESCTLTASAKYSSSKSLRWSSSNTDIVSVTRSGVVKGLKNGTVTIKVRTVEGVEAACRITVKNAPESIALSKSVVTLGVGESFMLSSTVNEGAASAKRMYSSSNTDIISMTRTDWQGKFVARKVGTAYVTVRTYNGIEAKCKVVVKAAPQSVTISKSSMTLKVGQSASLSASVPADSGCAARTYRSSNSSIVKVTKTNWTCSFTAMKPGTAYVIVRTYNGKESSCRITVI